MALKSDSGKGGRKMSLEWVHVFTEKNNEKTITKCKYCDSVLSSKIERIRTHLKKCCKFNENCNKNDSNIDTDASYSLSIATSTSTKKNEAEMLETGCSDIVKESK